MMKIVALAVTLPMILFVLACNRTACKRMCDCNDEGYDNEDDCVEDCEDMVEDWSDDCQKEFRSAARCMRYHDCDESECEEEYEDMLEECFDDMFSEDEPPGFQTVEPE